MSGYSSDAYGYDAYGYGGYGVYGGYGGGYGYYTALGPAQFDLRDEARLHLSGPGSTFYSASSTGSEYLHENDNGSLFGQSYEHSGSYDAVRTSYKDDAQGTSFFVNDEFVRDEDGLPFSQFYSGQPIGATSVYASEQGYSVDAGGVSHGSVTRSYAYTYADGSYRNVYSLRTYERDDGGAYVPNSLSYYRASTVYDASTGYVGGYHT